MTDIAIIHLMLNMGFEGWFIISLLVLLSIITVAVALQKWRELSSRNDADEEFLEAMKKVRRFEDLVKAVAHTRGEGLRSRAEAALVEDETLGVDPG